MGGYTLIEILVVIIILLIIATIILAYNRSTELNVLILTEQMKIKAILNQAKNFALEKRDFNFTKKICGYGVNLNLVSNNLVQIILFADLADDCLNADKIYDFNIDGKIKEYLLKPNLILKEAGGNILNNVNILFSGPYLEVYRNGSLLIDEYKFYLVNLKNQNKKGLIKVGRGGEISTIE